MKKHKLTKEFVPLLAANISETIGGEEHSAASSIVSNSLKTWLLNGWVMEKLASSGKFLERNVKLDSSRQEISWPSNSKRRSSFGTGDSQHKIFVKDIESAEIEAFSPLHAESAGKCVTIRLKGGGKQDYCFRLPSEEDAAIFRLCILEIAPGA